MERTLILNAGSSSVKFRLYVNEKERLSGMIDNIGDDAVLVTDTRKKIPVRSYREAGLLILSLMPKIHRVVYRVVHGGSYKKPTLITPEVLSILEGLVPLAPLHLPAALDLISLCMDRLDAVHIACFDTMFHRSMPAVAKTYAIPQELAKKQRIERYGFHGMAHSDMVHHCLSLLDRKSARGLRIITCQLGNGSSVCATRNGKSVDTTMGFTPLEGLVMGTRSGDIDPAIIEFLHQHEGMSVREIMELLEKQSGMLALAGTSDVRKILALERKGDVGASLALDVFVYHVRKAIGSYMAVLGGVDAIVLGGGIMGASTMRTRIFSGMEGLGLVVTESSARKKDCISTGEIPVFAVTVDEEACMFRLTTSKK